MTRATFAIVFSKFQQAFILTVPPLIRIGLFRPHLPTRIFISALVYQLSQTYYLGEHCHKRIVLPASLAVREGGRACTTKRPLWLFVRLSVVL